MLVLRSLARRIEAATLEADTLEQEIRGHVRQLVPQLLDEPGVPIVAAVSLSSPGHTAIASAMKQHSLAAVRASLRCPPQAASRPPPPRRGGDRQLNRALHTVILHRRQHDPATRDYIARRIAEGKSTRDATRILKRYLARHLYRIMQNASPTMT